jgi:hypothetical protein
MRDWRACSSAKRHSRDSEKRGEPGAELIAAEWGRLGRPQVIENLRGRLVALSDWLGEKDYLEGSFSAADILITTVLRESRTRR